MKNLNFIRSFILISKRQLFTPPLHNQNTVFYAFDRSRKKSRSLDVVSSDRKS